MYIETLGRVLEFVLLGEEVELGVLLHLLYLHTHHLKVDVVLIGIKLELSLFRLLNIVIISKSNRLIILDALDTLLAELLELGCIYV
jgi:hypothetical protein